MYQENHEDETTHVRLIGGDKFYFDAVSDNPFAYQGGAFEYIGKGQVWWYRGFVNRWDTPMHFFRLKTRKKISP